MSKASSKSVPKGVPAQLVEFLYELGIDRTKKKEFYNSPGKAIDSFNKKAKASGKPEISKEDRDMLVLDAREHKRIYDERRANHKRATEELRKEMPKSNLENKYGLKMPVAGDTQNIDDDEQ